jgi:hypothetical protein
MNETFRPRSNFIWAGASLVLLLLFAINSLLVAESVQQIILELGFALFLAATAYLIWVKPKMVLRDDLIEVVNPLGTELIRYADVLELDTKWALTIIHSNGKTKVWVAPAGGKQRWVADKKFGWLGGNSLLSEPKHVETETMSASLHSASGQAAYMIQERIKRIH